MDPEVPHKDERCRKGGEGKRELPRPGFETEGPVREGRKGVVRGCMAVITHPF